MRANNFIDMTGKRFDRLQVISLARIGKDNHAVWHCRCDCGKEVDVVGKSLRNGSTHSCGCLNVENSTKRIVALNTKHGKTHTRLFRVWANMICRCENPMSDKEVIERMTAYENYMKEHHVDSLPRRIAL